MKQLRLLRAIHPHLRLLGFITYVAGLIFIFYQFPSSSFAKSTYLSENALLPGKAESEFTNADVLKFQRYFDGLAATPVAVSAELARIQPSLYATQRFSYHGLTNQTGSGVNVYTAIRAPRSDGSESLVLAVPFQSVNETGHTVPNSFGIAIALSLFESLKHRRYWAKDIVLVFADGMPGMSAWLQAYHGGWNKGWTGERLRFHAGSIQAAMVLDFGQSVDYNFLGVLLEGTDGQMPNLDFLNVLVEIARYEGVPIQLHSKYFDAIPFQQHGYRFYDLMNSARNLLTMMFNQASGLPSGLHGLFLKYRIDALTLYGVHGPSSVRLGVWQTAMVVESMFRSLNNLLERFHQSFFYYLLPATYRYISIGMYYPALGLIVAGMLLMALGIWFETSQYYEPLPAESAPPTSKGFRKALPAQNTRPRQLLPPSMVLIACFLTSLVVYGSPFLLNHALENHQNYTLLHLLVDRLGGKGPLLMAFNLLITASAVWLIRRQYSRALQEESGVTEGVNDSRLLKCLLLLVALIALAGISIINISFSLALSIFLTPVLMVIGPRYPSPRIGNQPQPSASGGRLIRIRSAVRQTVSAVSQTTRKFLETILILCSSPLGAGLLIYLGFIRGGRTLDTTLLDLRSLIFDWLPSTISSLDIGAISGEQFFTFITSADNFVSLPELFGQLLVDYSQWLMQLLVQWDLVGSASWLWVSVVWTPLCMAACVLAQS